MSPANVSMELVQDSFAALRRARAENVLRLELHFGFCECCCHRVTNPLNDHLDCWPANFLDLAVAAIRGMVAIEPVTTQA